MRFEREDGQERNRDDEEGKEERFADLLRGFDDHVDAAQPGQLAVFVIGWFLFCLLPAAQPFVRVLDQDDGGVHHRADRDGDSS